MNSIMYLVSGMIQQTCEVPGIFYHQYLVPEYSYILPLKFISEKKSVSPARSVILIHDSDLCMHEEQTTKAARPNEAMSDRLVLLLSLLLLLLPLTPDLPLLLLCCYRHRTDNVRREPVSVYSRGVGMLYVFLFPFRNA